jgi:4-hydroxythreonine-4-phosphate dehydrogenase
LLIQNNPTRLPLAVTCGDPAGIGIEIFLAAQKELSGDIPLVLFADRRHLPPSVPVTLFQPQTAPPPPDHIWLRQIDFAQPAHPGRPDPRNAAGVIAAIEEAVRLTEAGQLAGLCTAPIHKAILQDGAGFQFPGHTEFLAHLCGVQQVVMMLTCSELSVVPLTIHIPISDVPKAITQELFHSTAQILNEGLRRDFGIAEPRISVAGLNPHASEGGKIGREDIDQITPWIGELHSAGLSITGPHSADTLFHPKARASYDAALCMYHDQALIPIKTLDFSGGVNVTLGLPIVRTSPDHGTAFDIAGQGLADPSSMVQAIGCADRMIRARKNAN